MKEINKDIINFSDVEQHSGGFRYFVTKEQIKKWRSLTPKERLDWLKEINEFLFRAQTKQARTVWQQFRHGRL